MRASLCTWVDLNTGEVWALVQPGPVKLRVFREGVWCGSNLVLSPVGRAWKTSQFNTIALSALTGRGSLTSFRSFAVGALDSHERNMIKTGILIKKIIKPARGESWHANDQWLRTSSVPGLGMHAAVVIGEACRGEAQCRISSVLLTHCSIAAISAGSNSARLRQEELLAI